jgi:hypothetical protein
LSGQPDTLVFFKNYFVTGDYVVGGVGLRGRGDATGWATGQITIAGIPANSVVVAAFLYWEAIEATDTPSTANGYFQGYPILGTLPANGIATPPCWSRGGGTGTSNGAKHLRVYRADVAPYLVINGQYQTNGNYSVKLQDSGSNGAGTPLTEGATLVVVYRNLSAPLRSVVFYDGSWTMNNSTQYMSQDIKWFYQAAPSATGKLTHIVGDGQTNFGEYVRYFSGPTSTYITLPSPNPLYSAFYGSLGGSWDNPTFTVPVDDNADRVATWVVPNASSFDCLSWGALVFSTPVKDQDGDGLLDIWEDKHGYADSKDGSWVALPGASKTVRDLFVQVDYLKNTDTSTAPVHSHLPKQTALDAIGSAFAKNNIVVHFDVGGAYQGDPFVAPAATAKGGNAMEEDSVACTDGTTLCDFPSQALGIPGIVSWKTGLNYAKNQFFQHGRKDSYHYVLMGHALGLPANTWSIPDGTLQGITVMGAPTGPQTATVTTTASHGLLPNGRVTIAGAVGDFNLNGTYLITGVSSPNSLTVTTTGVTAASANGATSANFGYFANQVAGFQTVGGVNQINEPNLVLSTGAPLSISGFSDLGGGDSLVTLGLWQADDPANCQPDPSVALTGGQAYCNNLVGSTTVQAGTIMHEIGHTLYLTHGGYYPAIGAFGENCKSNFLSVMNYMFQIRGLPNRIATTITPSIDYSGQTLATLDETSLNEGSGVTDGNGGLAAYGIKYYGPPSYIDTLLQNINNGTGNRFAAQHCDGTPKAANEIAVKIDAPTVTTNLAGVLVPAAIDWNNDGVIGLASQDINFDGYLDQISPPNSYGLTGFNDWNNLYLQQIGSRRNSGGFSADIGTADISGGGLKLLGGGLKLLGGGSDLINGGSQLMGSGLKLLGGGLKLLGGGLKLLGGGLEIDFDSANTVVDAPVGVTASLVPKSSVKLQWFAPSFGQIRAYYVWRANVTKYPMSASNPPVPITTTPLSGTTLSYVDSTVKTNQIYEYYVTAALGADSGSNAGNQSGPSNFVFITVK